MVVGGGAHVRTTADLQAEVLERMAELGTDRVHSPSTIARHGEPRSVTAVWNALELLWERDAVVWTAEGRYRLPRVGERAQDQLTIGDC